VAGLDDRSRARADVPRAVTFRAIATVKELQENPRLGEFRIHAALRQQGIYLSPRTCGRILAKHRALYGLKRPDVAPREPKPHPFRATRPHEYWFLDIRYLDHQLGNFKVYTITLLTSGEWGQDRQITLFTLLFKPRSAAIPTLLPHLALSIDDDQRDCVRAENLPDNDPFDHRVFVAIAARVVMPFSRLRCGNPPTR